MKRIALIGLEGSGKTVLLTALAKLYGKAVPNRPVLVPRTKKTVQHIEKAASALARSEWPPSTRPGDFIELNWNFRFPSGANFDLRIFDSAGQDLRILFADEQIQQFQQLPEPLKDVVRYVRLADIAIILVNLENHIGEGDLQRCLDNQWAIQTAIETLTSRKGAPCEMALVLTQIDRYGSYEKQYGSWAKVARQFLPIVNATHLQSQAIPIFAVSAVGSTKTVIDSDGTPRRVPGATLQCRGFSALIAWLESKATNSIPVETFQQTSVICPQCTTIVSLTPTNECPSCREVLCPEGHGPLTNHGGLVQCLACGHSSPSTALCVPCANIGRAKYAATSITDSATGSIIPICESCEASHLRLQLSESPPMAKSSLTSSLLDVAQQLSSMGWVKSLTAMFTFMVILGTLLRGCGNETSRSGSAQLPPIPIEASTRPSVGGGSLVIRIKSVSTNKLFDVVFEGRASRINKSEIRALDDFSPGQTKEIGWRELKSWNVQPGETFSLSARGFQSATFIIPANNATGS